MSMYIAAHILAVLLTCMLTGCWSANIQTKIHSNIEVWDNDHRSIQIGSSLWMQNDIPPSDRTYTLQWSDNQSIPLLVKMLNRPSYTQLRIEMPLLEIKEQKGKVHSLDTDTRTRVQQIWEERILLALSSNTFQVDKDRLISALDANHLTIHYYLVGRFNSAEMGHKDVVQFFAVDKDGYIVARTKPEYSLDYPLGFVDRTDWPYEFLF